MVISQEIIEREMEYRGSKSSILNGIGVKEQREDGSSRFNFKRLRYSLMGFERNYQIRIPSKQYK